MSSLFADWDEDGNGELDDLEFVTALYYAWDLNADERVDLYEYKFGEGAWFAGGQMYGTFSEGTPTETRNCPFELRDRPGTLFVDWDADGSGELTSEEFRTRMHTAWDVNGDDIVDLYEFNRTMHPPPRPGSPVGARPRVNGYGSFGSYDANSDAKVSLREFRSALAKTTLFSDLDSLKQGNPKDEGFREKLFEFWDLDGDDKLDSAEFKHGAGVFFPDVDTYGNFAAWDSNGDGSPTKHEFVTYEGAQRIFTDWDKNSNQSLEDDDVTSFVYEAWDTNGDGTLDLAEWRWW